MYLVSLVSVTSGCLQVSPVATKYHRYSPVPQVAVVQVVNTHRLSSVIMRVLYKSFATANLDNLKFKCAAGLSVVETLRQFVSADLAAEDVSRQLLSKISLLWTALQILADLSAFKDSSRCILNAGCMLVRSVTRLFR